MTKGLPITAEIVKLAQLRSRATGCDVRQEMARQIAQEAIMELDPELDLVLEEDSAYSREDRLVATFDVNDIVVNGARIDVRVLGEDGRVSIPRFLAGSSYMPVGTLAVSFNPDRSASVVGFVPKSDWDLQDKHAGQKEDRLIFRVANGNFDLSKIAEVVAKARPLDVKYSRIPLHASDIAQFCGHRQEMKLAKQRDFLEVVLHNESYWADLQYGISKPFVRQTLSHASVWNKKLDGLAETLKVRFQRLSKDDIKNSIGRLGEQLGSNIESPVFRKQMLQNLASEELAHSLKGEQLNKAKSLIEQIFKGRSVVDVLKDSVKNSTAVDVAMVIKRQRQRVVNFIDASSDEIAFGFRQLALQPVYATHSSGDGAAAVESVNEALNLLDAGELAEALKAMEHELG